MHSIARTFHLNSELSDSIQQTLLSYDLDISKSSSCKKIAENVLRLSDFFIANPHDHTPWHEKWAQVAYVSYFLPLNFLRLSAIFSEAKRVHFFKDLENLIDFGSGPGTAFLSLVDHWQPFHSTFIEVAEQPIQIFNTYFKPNLKNPTLAAGWERSFSSGKVKAAQKTLGVFSYSLTEQIALPEWAFELEALAVIEPSTQEDGRRLLELREDLIQRGFTLWAPCLHQKKCPLLHDSKKDWCHDRIQFPMPDWFSEIESYLPIKNQTVTMSYLLARKKKPAQVPSEAKASLARVIGDSLHEKGKDRQLICRSEDREFLAWLHKNSTPQDIPRGSIIELPEKIEKKSNEIRLTTHVKILND